MAEKTFNRTAIADFYLVDDDTDKRKLITAGDPVEMTKRQFDRAVKAGCVHADEAADAEAKADADRKAARAKASADAAAASQRKPEDVTKPVPAAATEMRTEAGERKARADDQGARDKQASASRESHPAKR